MIQQERENLQGQVLEWETGGKIQDRVGLSKKQREVIH